MEPQTRLLELTDQTISKIYAELETLSVHLEQNPQRGLQYLNDKILECRRAMDRCTDLLTQVRRLHPGIRTSVRNLKAQLRLVGTNAQLAAELNEQLSTSQDQDDEIRYLVEVIKARLSNLTRTNSDIRLLWSVVELQIKLGEIQPGRLTGIRNETPVTDQEHPVGTESISTKEIDVPAPTAIPVQSTAVDSIQTSDVLAIEAFLDDLPMRTNT